MTDALQVLLLPNLPVHYIPIILVAFLCSELIKGFRVSLPATAMALLTFYRPKDSHLLMVLPIIFANIMQFFVQKNVAKRHKNINILHLLLCSAFSLPLCLSLINRPNLWQLVWRWLCFLNLLFGMTLPISSHGMAFGTGDLGILGGLSFIWSPPVAMYLLARNVSKRNLLAPRAFCSLQAASRLQLASSCQVC